MSKLISSIPKLINAAKPQATHFLSCAKVELTPPKPSEIPVMINSFGKLISAAKSGAWKNVTVKEATLNILVAVEVWCWFYIGECIGKRHLIGYKLN